MRAATGIAEVRAILAGVDRPLGFVPTMGALHAGHVFLVSAARAQCATIAASVYVNPLQFGPGEDFERYPRDDEGDRARLKEAGVDVLFTPETQTMRPAGFSTFVDVGKIATTYEGASRPAHFRGVATVVAKLLGIMQPDALYLGQKDAQQTAVVRKMVRDLDLGPQVRIVPTVREPDGLALSSRNAYLSSEERAAAPTLHAALERLRDLLQRGVPKETAIVQARRVLSERAQLEYLDVVDADDFEPLDRLRGNAFVIGAARFGKTRLLDNLWIH